MTAVTARDRVGAPVPARPRAARRATRIREALVGYGFLAPNLVLMAIFLFVPIVWAIVLSFQETKGFGTPDWVGADNYVRLFSDPIFWQSLGNTAIFTVLTVPVDMLGGLALAVLLNSALPARGIWRTVIVLPMVISSVASGMSVSHRQMNAIARALTRSEM